MGNISTNGTIKAQSFLGTLSGYTWYDGIHSRTAGLNFPEKFPSAQTYYPLLNFRTRSDYSISFGGVEDLVGFFIAKPGFTENVYSHFFYLSLTENIIQTSFFLNAKCYNSQCLDGYTQDKFVHRLSWANGDGNNVNALAWVGTTFAYQNAHNAPTTGPFCSFGPYGGLANYTLQLQGTYHNSGKELWWRTYNGDAGAWNSWYKVLYSGGTLNTSNYGTSAPTVSGNNGDIYFKIV